MESNELTPYENLDRLLLVELRLRNMPAEVIPQLYAKARGEYPLSYVTAKAFLSQPKARVGIVTGVELPPYLPHGEIDGLIGSVVLARALGRLGGETLILTEAGVVPVIERLIDTLAAPHIQAVNASSLSPAALEQYAQDLDMGVSIEKIGINRKGITHTIEGKSYTSAVMYADDFIGRLNAQGKTTVGYGDGGNEIGFGKIFDEARTIAPFGAQCQCPCGDGIITGTATSVLWPVNVSNFGAYATVAAIAIQAGDPQLALTPVELLRALDAAIAAGAVDGGTGLAVSGEDGIPAPTAAAFVQIMRTIVEHAFRNFERPF